MKKLVNLYTSIRERTPLQTLDLIQSLSDGDQVCVDALANHTLSNIPSVPIYEAVMCRGFRSDYFCLGKGFDEDQSQISCLMEALEMSLIEQQKPDSSLSFRELSPNARIFRRTWSSSRLQVHCYHDCLADSRMHPSVDLRTGGTVYLFEDDIFYASECVKTQYGPTTNGLASGNSKQEAIFHGMCELIERNAIYEWGQRQLSAQTSLCFVEYSGVPLSVVIVHTLEEIFAAGYHVYFSRLPTSHSCYVYEAGLIRGSDATSAYIFPGWGAHTVESIAMNRALAEAVQILAIHEAIKNQRIPDSRLPGRDDAQRRISRSLGDLSVFQQNIEINFSEYTPRLWNLRCIPEFTWKPFESSVDFMHLLGSDQFETKHCFFTLSLAPEDFPFSVQLTLGSGLMSPQGL